MNQENNKFVWSLLLVILIVLVILGFNKFYKTSDNLPIKIGVILPLTGDLGFIGESAKLGAEMALADFSNTKNKYELVFEDDQYNVNKTVTAANKLISVDKVSAIVSLGSAEANVVKPLATKNKLIHFTTAASDQTIPDGLYTFDHWTPPTEEASALVGELVKRNIKKIALFTTNNDGMIAISNELENQAEKNNILITMEEKLNVGSRDFRTQIMKLKADMPEIIIMQNTPPELEILARQIKEAGIKIPMTSVEVFDTTTSPELFAGNWYATVSDPTEKFANSFKAKYGKGPVLATGNVYDIITLIITGFENTKGQISSDKVSQELHKIQNFAGAMGNISIADNGIVLSKSSIKTVKEN
jgi:branched-chain amino acid transport system substrate-binding protein